MGAIAEGIMAYAQPLIDATDGSIEQLNRAMTISQACWNLAITPEDRRQEALDGFRSCFGMNDVEFDDFKRSILLPMILRHEEMFPRMHGREPLEPPHWERRLPLTPTISPPKGKSSTTGRYDPCPCGSGKKHKFCCGRGRG